MARNPKRQQREKVIVGTISMWIGIIEQYLMLLLELATCIGRVANESIRERPRTLTLPLPRIVYREGFLHFATKTTNKNCINMLRMNRYVFKILCGLVKDIGGLERSKNMEIDEMVAIFLVTIGHNIKHRTTQVLFHRSTETISRTIKAVLTSILKLHHILLADPVRVPDDCTDARWKFFKGCYGALDGTLINVRAPKKLQARYRSRKGTTAITVLGVCNINMQFTYCLAGWEGSAHDSRVLRDALSRPNGFRVPAGGYYLCDAGYTNARGFLTPVRGQRYHLQEWGTGRSRQRTPLEYYNMKHASARNVIERAFGILKLRWALLRDTS